MSESRPDRSADSFWFTRFAKHNRDRTTRSLVGVMLLALVVATPTTWLSVEHFRTFAILDDRGVTTSAEVVALTSGGRGPHEVTVVPDDNTSVRTRLHHWPRGTEVGDRLRITYDPVNPGRVVATDAPVVDTWIATTALLEIGALWLVVAVVPPGIALLLRRARDPAWRPRPDPDAPGSEVGLRAPRNPLVWGRAAWRKVGDWAREVGALKAIMIFVFLPVTLTSFGAGLTVEEVRGLVALEERGVPARAEVLGSEWAGNRQEELTVLVDAEVASISRWTGVPRYGDLIDVIHLPEDRQIVRQIGVFPWGDWELIWALVGLAGIIMTPFVVPAAITGLLRR
ncbi:DUF3592 domain-containing protein [Promicromonospora sp. NPDC050249]|uniref:DUF3592 domain-containing protein n=1 Tax=Promicromonospora sp. NPDC050249 TaxID=3154743 RepID=UPI0033D03300